MRVTSMTAMVWTLVRLLVRLLSDCWCNRHVCTDICKAPILFVRAIARSHFWVPRWRRIVRFHLLGVFWPQIFAMLSFKERLVNIDMHIWTLIFSTNMAKVWTLLLLPALHLWRTIVQLVGTIEIMHSYLPLSKHWPRIFLFLVTPFLPVQKTT